MGAFGSCTSTNPAKDGGGSNEPVKTESIPDRKVADDKTPETPAEKPVNPDVKGVIDAHKAVGLLTPEQCGTCHKQHYEEWRGSMHSYAAKDPVFLAMLAKGIADTKGKLDQFCVQCHAPMASRLKLTPVSQNSKGVHEMKFDMTNPMVAHGVQCVTCHNMKSVEATLNAKFTLSASTYYGPTGSAAANKAHPMAKSSVLQSSLMCGTCHNVVNPKGALLENTFSEWYASDFNGDTPEKTKRCQDCHMPEYQGKITVDGPVRTLHRHYFVGVDQALIKNFPKKEEQANLVKKLLQSCAVLHVERRPDAEGKLSIFVSVKSINNGHNLPSGSTADRQVWVHLTIKDEQGALLYESGMMDKNGDLMDRVTGHSVTPKGDPHLLMFGQFLFDEAGNHVTFPWEAARTEDNLIAPGQTKWREYLLPKDKFLNKTVTVEAVLNYRTFPPFLIRKLIEEGYLKKDALEPIPVVEMARKKIQLTIR
tara:strand:+ start:10542 stop:11978 length:1437 start_codon:yes stop_codon:yes gene_type:complete